MIAHAQDTTRTKKSKRKKYKEEYKEFFETDSVPSLEFELDVEEPVKDNKTKEEEKERKKKKKKKQYKGIRGKRSFTKKTSASRIIIEKFYYLKDFIKPTYPFLQEAYFYNREKRRIQRKSYSQLIADIKNGKPYYILHGYYKKMENGQIREEGYYYIGAKDGYWISYDRKNILKEKILYQKGFPKESVFKFYDGGQKKIKEIIAMVHGSKHGTYLSFYENGLVKIQGQYMYDQKIKLWRYYYKNRRREKDIKYPNQWYKKEKGYIINQWNTKGQNTYNYNNRGAKKYVSD